MQMKIKAYEPGLRIMVYYTSKSNFTKCMYMQDKLENHTLQY